MGEFGNSGDTIPNYQEFGTGTNKDYEAIPLTRGNPFSVAGMGGRDSLPSPSLVVSPSLSELVLRQSRRRINITNL